MKNGLLAQNLVSSKISRNFGISKANDDEWEARNHYQELDMTGNGKRNPKASWDFGYKGKFKSPDEGCNYTDATFDAEGHLKDYDNHNWVR